ncbi:histone deacetylase 4-like isoform X3 [Littorina saxatilis]|uniref:Histone deacetylase n=1 Tax=Littorina saxatilis TaxID=31220 RepID=A0AAN9BPL8_9CAEN
MTSNNYQYLQGSKFYKGSTSVDSGFQEPIDTVSSPDAAMETYSYPQLNRKAGGGDVVDQHLQTQLSSLKQQQQLQHQILLHQYQQQRQQLEQEHEKQLQEHIKYLQHRRRLQQEHEKQLQEHIQGYMEQQQQQKKMEQQRMEKEIMEQERLKAIKNKGKDEESAVASSEVKLKLQEFVLTKKQREAVAKDMTNSPPQFRHPWGPTSSSLDQSSPPLSNLSPPYPHPLLGKYGDDDFPLRKTASEPNIYKVRSALKQKLETRRTMIAHSPLMVRRRDRGPLVMKRKTPLSIETGVCGSNPDSGPNSPPGSAQGSLANGSLSSLHSKEESAAYMFGPFRPGMTYPGTDLSLYSSPSMPNISLGRPPVSGPTSGSTSSSVVTEEELRTALSARMGLPLATHILPGAAPCFFPSPLMMDSDFQAGSPQAASYLAAQGKLVSSPYTIPASATTPSPLAEPPQHPAHRLHRHHRPLGRTHSAPLPLGHPGFQQTAAAANTPQQQQQQSLLLQQQHEQYMKESQKLYLKQHIRQTVLQRAGSKTHMENVDEETEVKLAQEMKEVHEHEVVVTKGPETKETPSPAPPAPPLPPPPTPPTLPPPPPLPPAPTSEEMKEAESKMEEGALAQSELEKQQREREAFLSQQREIIKGRHRPSHHRPLSRTQSSPLVTFSVPPQAPADPGPVTYNFTTGLAYDTIMLKHQCSCNNNDNHLEHAGRIVSIWDRLTEVGLVTRCERMRSRKATLEELQSCHSGLYAEIFGGNPYNRQRLMENLPMRFCFLLCGGIGVDSDTVWNDMHTSTAARMAAGCVTEMAARVVSGDLKNGFAIVRPPGHHAEKDQAMGFCYFNSIAIAAKQMREKYKLNKVLIVDWDVHHGNGTQQMFYDDPHILYLSIHRHDNGNFFPGTGAPTECGSESGQGYNVNIAFGGGLNPPMGDAEYLTAFRTIVMPIAREFNPECVLVSSGFDAAKGHPTALGGYEVSAACFGHMTRELMSLAGGKVVLTLEGGYDVTSICDATEACVRALLGDELLPIEEKELTRPICEPAYETLQTAIRIQNRHWPCVKRYLSTLNQTLMEAQKMETVEADTVTALASLSMVTAKPSGSVEMDTEPMDEGT